ncbi:hypothetical protein ACN27G_06070 [Plantactinospora sp. WMMB334]|uniref:hypothetical protein n=1 Tax=Plantactinospora sp. WMMB334 TaxID=3404119 RepID=UPI003B9445A6
MTGVVVVDGEQWWTTGYAVAQLRVDRNRLADWVRRSKAAGHTSPAESCQRCAAGDARFPHVDPPLRRGPTYGYRAEQLLEAEAKTGMSTLGGRARDVPEPSGGERGMKGYNGSVRINGCDADADFAVEAEVVRLGDEVYGGARSWGGVIRLADPNQLPRVLGPSERRGITLPDGAKGVVLVTSAGSDGRLDVAGEGPPPWRV